MVKLGTQPPTSIPSSCELRLEVLCQGPPDWKLPGSRSRPWSVQCRELN